MLHPAPNDLKDHEPPMPASESAPCGLWSGSRFESLPPENGDFVTAGFARHGIELSQFDDPYAPGLHDGILRTKFRYVVSEEVGVSHTGPTVYSFACGADRPSDSAVLP